MAARELQVGRREPSSGTDSPGTPPTLARVAFQPASALLLPTRRWPRRGPKHGPTRGPSRPRDLAEEVSGRQPCCCAALLPKRELPPLGLHEPGRVAVVGKLAKNGRVERSPGGLAGARPVALLAHHLDELPRVHRLALLLEHLGRGVERRELLLASGLGPPLGLGWRIGVEHAFPGTGVDSSSPSDRLRPAVRASSPCLRGASPCFGAIEHVAGHADAHAVAVLGGVARGRGHAALGLGPRFEALRADVVPLVVDGELVLAALGEGPFWGSSTLASRAVAILAANAALSWAGLAGFWAFVCFFVVVFLADMTGPLAFGSRKRAPAARPGPGRSWPNADPTYGAELARLARNNARHRTCGGLHVPSLNPAASRRPGKARQRCKPGDTSAIELFLRKPTGWPGEIVWLFKSIPMDTMNPKRSGRFCVRGKG